MKKLSDHIKVRIEEMGLNTINALGSLIGVSPSTLRTMLDRNAFPKDTLQHLIDHKVLSGTLEELQPTYEFRIAKPYKHSAKFSITGEQMPRLSDYIKEMLAERRLTYTELANQLQVPGGSIKGWINDNSYPSELIQSMVKRGFLPNLPITELEHRYDFRTTRPRCMTQRFEAPNIQGVILRAEEQGVSPVDDDLFAGMVRTLFFELRENDTFWLITNNEIPIEWSLVGWQAVADELCASIKKGANLFYLSPDTTGHHKELFNGFISRIIARGFDAELVRRKVLLGQIGLDHTPSIASKVAIFREAEQRRVTTLVNTRVPGERWINYRPSVEFANHMLGVAFKAANIQ